MATSISSSSKEKTVKTTNNNKTARQRADDANKTIDELAASLKALKNTKYASQYINTIKALQKSLDNGTFFNPETDARAKQYRADYARMGERAMEDTLGRVAARTGGLASSYATAAAEQAYNNYMSELSGKIEDLRDKAEASTRANLADYMNFDERDYTRWKEDQDRTRNNYKDSISVYGNIRDSALQDYWNSKNYELSERELALKEMQAYAAMEAAAGLSGGGGSSRGYSGGGGGGSSSGGSSSQTYTGTFYPTNTSSGKSSGNTAAAGSGGTATLGSVYGTAKETGGKGFRDYLPSEYDEKGIRVFR